VPAAPTDPAVPPEDPEEVARQILLRRLTEQPRSRAELAKALAKRRVPDEVATRVLDRFTEVGLIDDAAFARSWVESRQRGRGLASRALAHELRNKGIDRQTAQEALGTLDPDDERRAAARLVRRKLASVARQPSQVARRRLVGMLARKGYPAGLAMAVVSDELAADRDAGGADPGAGIETDLGAYAAQDAVEIGGDDGEADPGGDHGADPEADAEADAEVDAGVDRGTDPAAIAD
jgi:regulatory protein